MEFVCFLHIFLTSVLQRYARSTRIPIDTLTFRTEVTTFKSPQEIKEAATKGAYIYGLFLEGAGWEHEAKKIIESEPKQLYREMPVIW